jgi:hypothetical protein
VPCQVFGYFTPFSGGGKRKAKTMTVNLGELTVKEIRVMSQIPPAGAKISVGDLFDAVYDVNWSHGSPSFGAVLTLLRDRGLIKWDDEMVCRADPAP